MRKLKFIRCPSCIQVDSKPFLCNPNSYLALIRCVMASHRISDIQRKTLKILHLICERFGDNHQPVPATKLFEMVAANTQHTLAASNYRTSCHTLVSSGLLEPFRNPTTSRLSFRLTSAGKAMAKEIYDEK